MKLSDIDPNDIEIVEPAQSGQSSSLRLSDFDPNDIEEVGPGILESTGRGALEGATFGFSGELGGAGSSAVQSLLESLNMRPEDSLSFKDKYIQERNKIDAANKLAEEANPIAYNVGDIGTSVLTGVLSGGAGLAGKGLLKTGLKGIVQEGLEKGSLKGLAALGATEGALHGMGRSKADLTKGEVGEFATDTAIGAGVGAVAPAAIKYGTAAVKAPFQMADDLLEKAWAPGRAYKQIKDVAKSGMSTPSVRLDDKAQAGLSDLVDATSVIKNKGLAQGRQYIQDLGEASASANKNLNKEVVNWKETLQKGKELVGNDIENVDTAILQALNEEGGGYLKMINDKLKWGRFNFDPIVNNVKAIGKAKILPESKQAELDNIIQNIRSGDYDVVSKEMTIFNKFMETLDSSQRIRLKPIKQEVQQIIDQTMENLPDSAAKNLYKKRMDLNKDYSLLAGLQDDIGAELTGNPVVGSGKVASKFSVAANPISGGTDSPELAKIISQARQSGNRDLISSTDDTLKAAERFNKFNFNMPEIDPITGKIANATDVETGLPKVIEKGSMFEPGTVQNLNEKASKMFDDAFGLQRQNKSSSSLKDVFDMFSSRPKTQAQEEQKRAFIQYIKTTYPDQADIMLNDIAEKSKFMELHRTGLDTGNEINQDLSGMLRMVKSLAEPVSYDVGRVMGKAGNVKNEALQTLGKVPGADLIRPGLNRASGTRSITDTIRALNTPIDYKETVQDFKNSQKQGDTDQ